MAVTMYGKENLWWSETCDDAEVYKHVEYPQQTLMACWQDDHSFDDRKTKGMVTETLRYENGKQKCSSASFSHLHLPGLGMWIMAASSNFSMVDRGSKSKLNITSPLLGSRPFYHEPQQMLDRGNSRLFCLL